MFQLCKHCVRNLSIVLVERYNVCIIYNYTGWDKPYIGTNHTLRFTSFPLTLFCLFNFYMVLCKVMAEYVLLENCWK